MEDASAMGGERFVSAPEDLRRLRRYDLRDRKSLFAEAALAKPVGPEAALAFLRSLPQVHTVREMRAAAGAVVSAVRDGGLVLLMCGAHLVKCGLTPLVVDLMERGFIGALATHGATCVHDIELALTGATSEDVATAIEDGSFGMARDTAGAFAKAAADAEDGLGRAMGRLTEKLPKAELSLFAACRRLGVAATVHVAVGTDIVHMHPELDAAALGAASHLDFRRLAGLLPRLEGGVAINFGSAVVMPEVFLKALSVARNIHGAPRDFVAINFDQTLHYRPARNVLERPGGRGYNIVGRHEVMLPLFRLFVLACSEDLL